MVSSSLIANECSSFGCSTYYGRFKELRKDYGGRDTLILEVGINGTGAIGPMRVDVTHEGNTLESEEESYASRWVELEEDPSVLGGLDVGDTISLELLITWLGEDDGGPVVDTGTHTIQPSEVVVVGVADATVKNVTTIIERNRNLVQYTVENPNPVGVDVGVNIEIDGNRVNRIVKTVEGDVDEKTFTYDPSNDAPVGSQVSVCIEHAATQKQ